MSSPLMEETPAPVAPDTTTTDASATTKDKKKLYMKYALIVVAVLLVFYVLYFSYSRFRINQTLGGTEPFIEKTVKTGTDSDRSFDIGREVQRLSDLQEQYLRKLNRRR